MILAILTGMWGSLLRRYSMTIRLPMLLKPRFTNRLLVLLVWAKMATGAGAGTRIQTLTDAVSPNRLCLVRVEQKPATSTSVNDISYNIVSRKTGKVLLSIPSSYSGGRAEDRQSAWDDAI